MEKSGISGIEERPELPPALSVEPAVLLLPAAPPLVVPGMEAEAVEEEPLLPDGLCEPGIEALEPAEPPPDDGMLALDEEEPEAGELEPDEPELDELELDELELDELELDELLEEAGLGMEGAGMVEDCDGCCREVVSQALSNRPPMAASSNPRKADSGRPVLSGPAFRYFMSLSTFHSVSQPDPDNQYAGQYQ